MSVIVDENIESGQWPTPLEGAWSYVFYHQVTNDTVMCIFFDDDFPEGSIIEGYNITLDIPQSYVSWQDNGICREIFVQQEYRNNGVGTAMCALARSYLLKKENKIFDAPLKMTQSAQSMYQKICNKYNETYSNPEDFPPTIPYGYWGGLFI